MGDPFFGERFSKKGGRNPDLSIHSITLYLSSTKKAPAQRGLFGEALYQLGNWKASKTAFEVPLLPLTLYQLGNWKASKTGLARLSPWNALYQLGNWKASKTSLSSLPSMFALYQLGNWKASKTDAMAAPGQKAGEQPSHMSHQHPL